jgi:hypothetical protein
MFSINHSSHKKIFRFIIYNNYSNRENYKRIDTKNFVKSEISFLIHTYIQCDYTININNNVFTHLDKMSEILIENLINDHYNANILDITIIIK